jgi:hypothetical protein
VKSMPGCLVTITPSLIGAPVAFFPLPSPHLAGFWSADYWVARPAAPPTNRVVNPATAIRTAALHATVFLIRASLRQGE